MLKNLLEQANEHVVKVNRLIGQVEDFDNILEQVTKEDSKVCVYSKEIGTTFVDLVLNHNIMDGLKVTLLESIESEKGKKVEELQSLVNMNIIHQNKGNEESVLKQDETVIDPPKDVIEPEVKPELTVAIVKEMYHKRGLTLDEAAKELGVSRTFLHTFISKNGLKKPSKKEKEVFRDSKIQAKERP